MNLKKLILFGMGLSMLLGCSKKAEKTASATSAKKAETIIYDEDAGGDEPASYSAMQVSFTPDFSYTYGDDEDDDFYLDTERPGKEKKEQSTSVIPGVRELSKYKTTYSEKRQEIIMPTTQEADEDIDTTKPFIIEEYGPIGAIAAEEKNPTFFVVFSQPVKALTALGEPSENSDIMTITPPLKGVFRWYGTRHLSFEASEPANPATDYTVSIKSGLTSIAKKPLEGMTSFTTKATPIRIINLFGAYIKDSDCAYSSQTGALPQYANRVYIRLNYMVTAEQLEPALSVKIGEESAKFSLKADYNKDAFRWYNPSSFDQDNKKSSNFILTISDKIPFDKEITVTAENDTPRNYHSLRPFVITDMPGTAGYTQGQKENPLVIRFSQKIDSATVADNISFDFDFKLTESSFEVEGRTLTIYNLPISYDVNNPDKNYKITIKKGLKDIYGQNLSTGEEDYTSLFSMLPPRSYVKFIDGGSRMLEAQYPHKLIFEHQNIQEGSFYDVERTENPFYTKPRHNDNSKTTYVPDGTTQVTEKVKNQRQFEEIDLNPYLNKDGYGWVDFEAHVRINDWDYWAEKFEITSHSNKTTIQVTDLGITVRLGINKAVAMVRSLSTDKPVEDAEVLVLVPSDYTEKNGISDSETVASGKTDKDGLAVISFTEEQIKRLENSWYNDKTSEWNSRILVIYKNDKALFRPTNHNAWRENVPTANMRGARMPKQRTFMFVDRGLYKPGETVSFRGIDRDQLLGELNTHTGSYTLKITESWWNGKEIVEPIQGTLSPSGGFYGSFKLPDNVEPGTYKITYSRAESSERYSYNYITFMVANFERLKFEASVTTPAMTFYGGDSLSASIKASYLAGGSLSGAKYDSIWFNESTSFNPTTPVTKGFTFGPSNVYSGRTQFSQEKGELSGDGTATLSCTSEKITDGKPYMYHVEANITDVSNQRISAQTNILVHPAKFYVGIRKPVGLSGFAKKNSKLEFPFILVNPNGGLVDASSVVASLEYKLTREVWSMVHEQSVDDTIYTRYERSDQLEAKGKITPPSSGKLAITPTESGWYTLTISGRDISNNFTTTDYNFYVTGGSSSWYDRYNSQSISLTPNKNMYNPGERAEILLESPLPKGDYLITVEREGIFTEEVRHFDTASNVIEIPIATNYVPVVYVAVSSYSVRNGEPAHQYGEPDLDKPKGYFGITPLFINPRLKAFNVKIESDKKTYRPGETATLKLTATKNGKPVSGAELTVMAVDRGVIDLINYHVPNPIDFFYDRASFPLYVMGGDSRSMLMDPVTYSVKNLAGGDASAADNEKEDERKDFRPTALFEPALITDKDGTVTCTFKVPDSLTAYRITAFGVQNEQFALNEDEIKVQNPINVQQVQPRALRERDTAECGVLVTNLDNKGQNVTISLQIRSPEGNTAQDELEGRITAPGRAEVDGKAEHTVYVAPEDSSVVYFDVAAQEEGTVELVYSVKSDVLNERLVSPIRIEKTFVYETVTITGATGSDKKEAETELLAIPGFAKEGRGDLSITLDATRLGMLGGSVRYLFDYPYGCLEQQTSRVLPLLLFSDYIDVFGLDSKVSDPIKCSMFFITSWAKYQHSNGGFPYWPSTTNYESYYVSLRIAHICAVALKHGISESELKINISALKGYLSSGLKDQGDYTKAYALYVFSLLNDKSLASTLNALYSKADDLNLSTIAYLGMACLNNGDKARARELATKIKSCLQPVQRSVSINEKYRGSMWYWFESESAQMANILQLLVTLNPDDNMVDRLIYALLQNQSKGFWHSTDSTAKVLEGIAAYIQERDLTSTDYTATAVLNKKELMKETFKGAGAKPKTLQLPFEDEFISSLPRDKEIPLSFEKQGTGRLFYTAEMKYAIPDEMQTARDEGIAITFEISDFDTGAVINTNEKSNPVVRLEAGRLYTAKIKIGSTRNRDYLALRCPIPSGAEILDANFVTTGSAGQSQDSYTWRHRVSNRIILDNEVQYFWDTFKTGETTVTFTFRASRHGIYPTPPVQSECMYEPEVFGRSDGYLFVIE